jgi:hypothetical protein
MALLPPNPCQRARNPVKTDPRPYPRRAIPPDLHPPRAYPAPGPSRLICAPRMLPPDMPPEWVPVDHGIALPLPIPGFPITPSSGPPLVCVTRALRCVSLKKKSLWGRPKDTSARGEGGGNSDRITTQPGAIRGTGMVTISHGSPKPIRGTYPMPTPGYPCPRFHRRLPTF